MIEKLIKYQNELPINVIDESYIHERIEIDFEEPVSIAVDNKYEFINIEEIIYNTISKDVVVCIDDEFEVGYIPNVNNIWLIYSNKKVLYERGVTND